MRKGTIIILFVLFLGNLISTFAQKPKEIKMDGYAPFAANYEIRLINYTDYITFTPILVASAKIGSTGKFQLSYKSSGIQLSKIEINTSSSELFLVPGYNYNLNISMDKELFNLFNPEDENGFMEITPLILDTNDLNFKIQKFSYIYETILKNHIKNILTYRTHNYFDSLQLEVSQYFPVINDPTNFYYSYIFYTLGQMEAIVCSKEPQKIFDKYFNNDYILYDNPAYMMLFNYYYDNYLFLSPKISKEILDEAINVKCDYLALFNEIGKDFSLVNERLRELVIIKNLTQFIENPDFNQDSLSLLIQYIIKNTKFPEHKKIAESAFLKATKFLSGSAVEKFDFKYANGSKFNPADLKDKWVFYQFFSTQCVDCIREMLIIDELQKAYKDKIVFVSVSVDADPAKFIQFKKKYKQFDWEFVHFNNSYMWMEKMEIFSLPEYLLFSPDGSLYMRYPPALDKELPILLLQLFSKEEIEKNPLDVRGGN
jgi:thiol-disulfide isomerase/thioredoxin